MVQVVVASDLSDLECSSLSVAFFIQAFLRYLKISV